MSKIISESSNYRPKKIIKSNGINNLPKVQKKIISTTNEEIITTTKNEKTFISGETSNVIGPGSIIQLDNQIPNQKFYKLVTYSPDINYHPVQVNQPKEILLQNNNINTKLNKNIIYNNNQFNNNDYYESKYQQKITHTNKEYNESGGYTSCSYDVKRTKKTIKYSYNSPERTSKIFVKSILCSPISVSYTEIDKPILNKAYNAYKEETEETEIMIRTKMKKIWENEGKCVTECNFSYIGDSNYSNNYIIEEYERKIEELNSTVYSLKNIKTTLEQQIEELTYSLNNKEFFNMGMQSFHFNFNKYNKNNNNINYESLSWNEIIQKENINSINIVKTKKIKKPLLIQNLEKINLYGKKKQKNVIEYGTYLEILTPNTTTKNFSNISIEYGNEIYIPGKLKFKNKKQSLKGSDILRKSKHKYIIQYPDEIKISMDSNLKLKQKPKFNNIIEATNNIFIPSKKKELFTWDTFFGQELYILAKKKKKKFEIVYLEDLEILKAPRPQNEIEFNDTIGITPEPKAPFEINFTEEFYIPESINKLKAIPKPKNKIVNIDKIRLLGKNIDKNIIQKVSLIEIYPLIKPKIIEYEENDSIFIPGLIRPDNVIEEGDYIQIFPEYVKSIELICETCDLINIFGFDIPKNEQQTLEGFDIISITKPINENIIEQIDPIFIEPTPKMRYLYIEYGDEMLFEQLLKPENDMVTLKGFTILKSEKPLNEIEYIDEIELQPEVKQPFELLFQNNELFSVEGIKKPENKLHRIDGFEIIVNKPKTKIITEKINDINILGKKKSNELFVEFGDEIIIEEEDRPIYKKQRTEEVKILKKPKMKNIKQNTSNFQLLKKFKLKSIKPINKIQKCENINLYPKTIKNNNKLEIYFGDELYIEGIIKPNEEKEIITKTKKPIKLICQKKESFTIEHIKRTKNKNKIHRIGAFDIIKQLKPNNNICQKLSRFYIGGNKKITKNINYYYNINRYYDNVIENTENFQIISVSIRELYQQRLQGFMICKKEKRPFEMEKNYNFIILKKYNTLYGRSMWNNLYIQNEHFYIQNERKFKNEIQDDFLIEGNSQSSKFKDTFLINDSFTNSKDLSLDICRFCGGKKRLNDDFISDKKINVLKSKEENYNYRKNTNISNVHVVKNNLYKTLLALPQNEIDYINNIEISCINKNDKYIYNSDDEEIRTKKFYKNNINNYNKKYNINKNTKILEYNKNYNNISSNNTSDICNISQTTDDFRKNENNTLKTNKRIKTSNIIRKRIIQGNEINNNNFYNNYNNYNNYQKGFSRYTFYRHFSNSGGETSNRMYQRQSKSQLKTIPINKNQRRKLFRFEEGKGIKIIYQ